VVKVVVVSEDMVQKKMVLEHMLFKSIFMHI
jgi:hypothetical protein